MNGHDPLCRAFYQMHMNANICRSCDLIKAVREDQTRILNSKAMYQSGYDEGYDMGLDHAIACFEEDDPYGEIQKLRGS